jgi:type I restriction enzyme S subunit
MDMITDNIDIWTSAIKTRSSAGRGSSKKLDLYGIKKLRELILELAVRGKLVPQDLNDEPASVLLERIAAEKAQLVKEKKIKKPKVLPEISEDEKPFELPEGWEWTRLNDLGEWGAGATPKRGNSEFYGGDIPWFKSGELNADYITNSEESVTQAALEKTSLRYNKVGDVLVAMYGATIGKTAILGVRATTNQAVCACTPFSGFSNIYLLALLKAYKSRLIGMGAGGAQPNISREKIVATVIALPPLAEQHRIVAKVDELMALCDQLEQQTETSINAHATLVETLLTTLTNSADAAELEQNWTRLADHFDTLFTTEKSIDQLKQTVLQLAVMGKLVPQDPSDEPAAALLEKIAAEKAQLIKEKKIKKQKPLPPITEGEKPFKLPEGWEWCRLQETVLLLGDGLHGTPHYDEKGDYYFVNGNNLRDGRITIKPETKRVSQEEYEKHRKQLNERTVLVSINGTLGNVAFYNNESVMLGKSACYFNLWDQLDKYFYKRLIESPYFVGYAFRMATGSTIKNLGLKAMNAMPIALPPLVEQHHIVAKVDQLMALCDQLKTRLQQAQQTQLHLADALVEQTVG